MLLHEPAYQDIYLPLSNPIALCPLYMYGLEPLR